jgi:hypothetical protein
MMNVFKPPSGHPQAIWWPTGRHPEATLRLPSGYPEAGRLGEEGAAEW